MKCGTKSSPIASVYDLRLEPIPRAANGKFKLFKDIAVRRNPGLVDGIVLHQTAIEYGASDRQIRLADGDEQLAIARRAKGIACHACSFEGYYTKTYPLSWYIYHGNALNRTTLGLEIEGRYPGLLDDPRTIRREDLKTLWKGEATPFSTDRLNAAKAALHYLVKEGRALGMPIQYVYAHRQAKSNRRSDPGEELWQKLAVEYGVAVLGLETRPSYTIGTGRPIPPAWDSRGIGTY
jgi:hypothetical protein